VARSRRCRRDHHGDCRGGTRYAGPCLCDCHAAEVRPASTRSIYGTGYDLRKLAAKRKRNHLNARHRAREFVEQLRAQTVCAWCGQTPIEWHNPSHAEGREGFRIANLTKEGYSPEAIQREIDVCVALCRACHAGEEHRLGKYRLVSEKVRGEGHGRHKLTTEDVLEIRRSLAAGSVQAALAEEYGVARCTISDINIRRRWKHL